MNHEVLTVIRDIIDDDDAVCSTVVRGGDGTEALLTYQVREFNVSKGIPVPLGSSPAVSH